MRTRRYAAEDLAPMNCKAVSSVDELGAAAGQFLMNPKLDGWRLVCVVEEDHVDMMTRGLKWQDGMLPNVEAALLKRFAAGTVLDGEICALRSATCEEIADGRPGIINDFEHVGSIMNSSPDKAVMKARMVRPLTYHCFDILSVGDMDITSYPLEKRIALLNGILDDDDPEFRFYDAVPDDIDFQRTPYIEATQQNYDALVHAGFEGAVLKRKDSTYEFGIRDRRWLKIKHEWTMDAVIMGFKPGKGKNTGKVGSFTFGQPRDGKLVERGHCRGFTDAVMEEATANPDAYVGCVIEVSHNGAYPESPRVRHPQFKRMRPDKTTADVDWRHR